jgi:hypothetical protein
MNIHTKTAKTTTAAAKRPVRFSEDGRMAFVTTSRGDVVKLDRQHYESLMAMGVSPNWASDYDRDGNGPYIRVRDQLIRNKITIARIIAGAGRGEIVGWINGDRLDLRAENLVLSGGAARRNDAWIAREKTIPHGHEEFKAPEQALTLSEWEDVRAIAQAEAEGAAIAEQELAEEDAIVAEAMTILRRRITTSAAKN